MVNATHSSCVSNSCMVLSVDWMDDTMASNCISGCSTPESTNRTAVAVPERIMSDERHVPPPYASAGGARHDGHFRGFVGTRDRRHRGLWRPGMVFGRGAQR